MTRFFAMLTALQIVSLCLVAIAWALAFAHAAEMPGKMRLDRQAYLTVQPIYYPGFTIAASSEPLSIVALGALLALTPTGSDGFWLTATAFAAVLAMHAVYWLVTHPANRFWLSETALGEQVVSGASRTFFEAGKASAETEWTRARDRWEYSHLVRALLMTVALVSLAIAITR